jgi:hypothetical protein
LLSAGQLVRTLASVVLVIIVCNVGPARAEILPHLSGNHRARAESSSTPLADESVSFAVFRRSGVAGDVFGTGLSNFDSLFSRGSGSPAFDTTAEYLYLYQAVNDGVGTANFSRIEFPAAQVTSWGTLNRRLADNDGVVRVDNPFGSNSASFQPAAPASLGVSGGLVSTDSAQLVPTSTSYTGGQIVSTHNLGVNATLSIFGFTSDRPPRLVTVSPRSCADNFACGSFVAPSPFAEAYFPVDPRATYLRAADELSLPQRPTIIELASAIPDTPIGAGDWILLQRVGDFAFVPEPSELPPELEGPHADEDRAGTLRNLYGIFSGSNEVRGDPQAFRGNKTTPIPLSDPHFSRVAEAKQAIEGNAVLVDSDDPGRFVRPGTERGDPFQVNNMTRYQLTDIPEDFYIDLEGDLENASPVLVRVPLGATHLFVGAGDSQFFDNRLTTPEDFDDGRITGEFGVRIAVVLPSRLMGDYNQDGTVNAADYTVWRANIGQTGVAHFADGNLNAVVDQADYQVWRANFGRTVSSSLLGSTSANLPEPAANVLVLAAFMVVAPYRVWCRR